MKVKDVMNTNVIKAKGSETIEDVTRALLDNKIGGLPIVDEEDKVIGVLSETDLIYKDKEIKTPAFLPLLGGFILFESIRKFEKQLMKMSAYKVSQVMTTPAITISEEKDIKEAVEIMIEKKINRIPVVNNEQILVGIVTRSDILRNL